jgi:hypothetical protein
LTRSSRSGGESLRVGRRDRESPGQPLADLRAISRLARSTRDMLEIAERLEKRGADLVSLTDRIGTTSAAGRMVFRMLVVMARFEREVIAERTRSALAYRKGSGEVYAPTPFGYEAVEPCGPTSWPGGRASRCGRRVVGCAGSPECAAPGGRGRGAGKLGIWKAETLATVPMLRWIIPERAESEGYLQRSRWLRCVRE